jgi:TDG/mug DNA glycosylase family protein
MPILPTSAADGAGSGAAEGTGAVHMPDKPLPDVVGTGIDVLFCGINPSLMSAARGHHFARPGNRFWPALHLAGLTPRRLTPDEDRELLEYGLGVTNLVDRPTRTAAELHPDEFREGAAALAALVRRYRPRVVAVLGVTAWRTAFGHPRDGVGRQSTGLAGAEAWVLPNPSGLNAHYQLPALGRLYAEVRGGRAQVSEIPST